MPPDVVVNGNITSRENAEPLTPEETIGDIIDGTRRDSVAMSLMRRLPNMTAGSAKMPVLDMLPIADFQDGDIGLKAVSNMAWAKKQLVAGTIAVILPIPKAVLADAKYDIWGQARPACVESIGRVFDHQVFNGGNPKAPQEWPKGLIEMAVDAGNVVSLGDGIDLLDDINVGLGKLEDQSYDITGIAAQKQLRAKFRGMRDKNNNFLFQTPTSGSDQNPFGIPIHYAGRGTWDRTAALAIFGEWENAVYSVREDMTFEVFREGVISNDEGKILYNLMQQNMIALRVEIRLAWQAVNPIDIDRDRTMFPFGVLRPSGGTPTP